MASKLFRSDGSNDLTFLQTVVNQQEGIYGPLIALTSEIGQTYLVFQRGAAPNPRSVLVKIDGEPAPARPPQTVACSGLCVLGGQETWVAAYR